MCITCYRRWSRFYLQRDYQDNSGNEWSWSWRKNIRAGIHFCRNRYLSCFLAIHGWSTSYRTFNCCLDYLLCHSFSKTLDGRHALKETSWTRINASCNECWWRSDGPKRTCWLERREIICRYPWKSKWVTILLNKLFPFYCD